MKKTAALIVILISLCAAVTADFGVSKFVNPICGAADPCIVKNPDGKGYYFVYTNEQGVYTEFALSPADFKYDFSNRIYAPEPGTICRRNLWAPELHKIDGKWYMADPTWSLTNSEYTTLQYFLFNKEDRLNDGFLEGTFCVAGWGEEDYTKYGITMDEEYNYDFRFVEYMGMNREKKLVVTTNYWNYYAYPYDVKEDVKP